MVLSLSTCSEYALVAIVVVAIFINLLIITAVARCLLLRSLRLTSAVLSDNCRVWHATLYSLRNPICGCWAAIKLRQCCGPRYGIQCCRVEAYHPVNGPDLNGVSSSLHLGFVRERRCCRSYRVACSLTGPVVLPSALDSGGRAAFWALLLEACVAVGSPAQGL